MAYEDIAIPIALNPASAGMFGIKVRDAILDLDRRMSVVESTLANYKFKNTNTTRASNITPSADPDLALPLEANTQYFVEVFLTVSGLTTGDLRTTWGVPAGTTGNRRILGPATGAGLDANGDNQLIRLGTHNFTTSAEYSLSRDAVGNQIQVQEVGVITVAATAGDFSLNWAQRFSIATGTVVHADSFVRATRAG